MGGMKLSELDFVRLLPVYMRDDKAVLAFSEAMNKLLGDPDFMPWEDWDEPCEGWKLLLQVDSQEDEEYTLQFMDEGVMYFLIQPDALSRADFSQVRGAMVSM